MGTLKDFKKYLDGRHAALAQVEEKLCALQEKYETFFAEINQVREKELAQLTEHILADRSQLDDATNKALDQAMAAEEAAFDQKLAALAAERDEYTGQAELLRLKSVEHEAKVRAANQELDHEEEALKVRNAKLLADIVRFNKRIREMGRGFGFIRNLFRMRKLQAERRKLDSVQADVAARIEGLRNTWARTDAEFAEQEKARKAAWLEATTQAAAVQTKIDYLNTARLRIVQRGAFEKVLFASQPDLPAPAEGDPACERCGQPNPPEAHFCHICAKRLVDDKPDLAGSLKEIAEVNLHHARFADGMQACQEIIGLVRGLKSGMEAFTESVVDMRRSESKHNLKTLKLDVPVASVQYGEVFEKLGETVGKQGMSTHPKVFAKHVKAYVDGVFTEEKIKTFFETMGDELSRQADAQW